MSGIRKITVLFLLAAALPLAAQGGDLSDFYYSYSNFADNSLFSDPNTGRTIFPTLLIPVGGMYEGMGTAYTAVAKKASFMEANPAGSSVLENTELTLQHNNWIADTSVEGVIYTMRFQDLGIGLGGKFLYLPFTAYNEWGERDARGYFSEMVGTANISYNFFSSYYFYGLAVGANMKFAYRNVPDSLYQDQGVGSQSILTAMTDVGMLTRFNFLKFYPSRNRNFSLGAAVKNIGLPSEGEPLPSTLTGGISYSPYRPVLLAFDLNMPFAVNLPPDKWENMYMAAGTEVQVTDFFSIHSGFTHRGANPRITVGSGISIDTMNIIVNYTLDMTTQLSRPDRFSIEANLNLGDRGRSEKRRQVDELYVSGLEAYSEGKLVRAIGYWEAALELDPTFQPAAKNIEVAERALNLRERMEEMNQVE